MKKVIIFSTIATVIMAGTTAIMKREMYEK